MTVSFFFPVQKHMSFIFNGLFSQMAYRMIYRS